MNSILVRWFALSALVVALGDLLQPAVRAFPPAPHHTLYGMVRDEWGNPLDVKGAEVVFETLSGTRLRTQISSGIQPGINYVLKIPMDSGLTADAYQPTAMRPTVAFRVKVVVGKTEYLPIELKGNLSQLGGPGKKTLLNLTLGEDSDGDGLPDAWERALIAQMGGGKTLADIRPGDDADGDGLSNLQEYLAGTYAFDPKDGFTLKVAGIQNESPILEFLTITGRNYRVQRSADLKGWEDTSFHLLVGSSTGAEISEYTATDVKMLRVLGPSGSGSSEKTFFRLIVR